MSKSSDLAQQKFNNSSIKSTNRVQMIKNESLKDDVLENIFSLIQDKNLALFCGAGISYNSPSNLPLASSLRKGILDQILDQELDNDTMARLEKGYYEQKDSAGNKLKYYYPFEVFIRRIITNGKIFPILLNIYKSGKPNKNHVLIAELIKRGYLSTILTTNFDTKIENALAMESISGIKWERGANFQVIDNEYQFRELNVDDINMPIIIKIHGSIDNEDSLRIIFDTIAKKELISYREKILTNFFKKYNVLVLGYSCSDEFDINPVIRKIKTENTVFRIKHQRKFDAVSFISILEDPFLGYNGNTIHIDTDLIINELWNKFIGNEYEDIIDPKKWDVLLRDWSNELFEGQKNYILAGLLYDVQKFNEADEQYTISQNTFKELKYDDWLAGVYRQRAILYSDKGDAESLLRSVEFCEESEEIFEKMGLEIELSGTRHQRAITLQKLNKIEEAKSLYEQNIPIFERHGEERELAASLFQLSMIYEENKEYNVALKYLLKSQEIFDKNGQLEEKAMSMHQQAIIFKFLNDYEHSKKLLEDSRDIFKNIGEEIIYGLSYAEQGNLEEMYGNYIEAKECLLKALRIMIMNEHKYYEKLILKDIQRINKKLK